MKTRLTTSVGWNPFDYCGQQINNILFYRDGKVVAKTDWFDSNNYYKWIEFDFDIKNAKKINLERTDAYLIRHDKCSGVIRAYDLYIHADLVNLQFVKSNTFKTWDYTRVNDVFTVCLHGSKRIPTKVGDDVKWIPKEDDYVQQFECNYTFEDTPEKKQCKEIADSFNEITHGNKFSYYDIERILEHYSITKK